MRLEKMIVFCEQPAKVACDANCEKAWGSNSRPKIMLSKMVDDYAWLSDLELGLAPIDPGTYEGGCAKPFIRPELRDAEQVVRPRVRALRDVDAR